MIRRLLVLSAAALAKICFFVLPLLDMVWTAFAAGRDSVTPLAAWGALLALTLAVYFACSAAVDLWWGAATWRGKELAEGFRFNWKRVLAVVLLLTALMNPIRAWQYLLGMIGLNDLTESAVLVDAQLSSNHHLLVLALSVMVTLALPPLRVFVRSTVRTWQARVAAAVLVLLAGWALPLTGRMIDGFFITALQSGNQRVFVGTQGWLFDRRELDALTGPAKHLDAASKTVLDFAAQLKERGVPLLVIPLPMKTAIYPEFITGGAPDESEAPLYHTRQPDVYAEWMKAGIDVQDITAALMQAKERKSQVFMKQSNFWTADMMQALASAIAVHVRKNYPAAALPSPMNVNAAARDGSFVGNLAEALGQTAGGVFKPERAVLLQFPTIERDPQSPTALLGGSAVRVFDDPSLGYIPTSAATGAPMKAGFAQHLALYLGRPVDVIAANDGAITECRRGLAQESDDQVRAKKLVIWLLPVVDLLNSEARDWQAVSFVASQSAPAPLPPKDSGQH